MRVNILKYVLFSIVICSFEYSKNELYSVNDRGIYLERDVINFRNNRILADVDNRFDLNEFYQSTLSLASQLGDCIEGNKEIAHLQNIIDTHIKKNKGSNTSLDLKTVDSKTKKLINELRTELEEVKKRVANKRNDELAIQSIHEKKIEKKDENSSMSEHEDFKQLENNENNGIASSNSHIKSELIKKYRKIAIRFLMSCLTFIVVDYIFYIKKTIMAEGRTNSTKYFIKEKMNICGKFDTLRLLFPDELTNSREYYFKAKPSNKYWPNGMCNNDIDKINGYCLWLFNQLYGDSIDFSNNVNDNMYIVTFILGWLSYKLNQKTENEITKLDEFYNKHMENVKQYNTPIDNITQYKTYIDLINNNKELMDIDIKVMSKFYDTFKNLCKMYSELSKAKSKGKEYLEYVNNFANNYNALINENFNDTNENSFKQVLSVALNDYNYIKNQLHIEHIKNQIPELPKEKTVTDVPGSSPNELQMDESSSGTSESRSGIEVSSSETEVSDSDSTSPSSSILNKFISIPFIFVVTLILLGIAYKVNNKSIKNILGLSNFGI
ncbi:hypothetical protein YYC_05585 [Plasmodium yoelii 17X]|uniref:Uncharacterized protein n=1 Tax=Plasmodium yoelii 17X TaxID=1323249 RepID=V7PBR7_PLAYE|nr:hypothetical protein YYC_05585 [Plasmodium yoelii 17X]